MKTPKEIEQLAEKLYPLSPNPNQMIEGFERVAYKKGYTQCQEDTKQILLDFIKWSDAVDEYGNKLDKIDVDNFLNKQY